MIMFLSKCSHNSILITQIHLQKNLANKLLMCYLLDIIYFRANKIHFVYLRYILSPCFTCDINLKIIYISFTFRYISMSSSFPYHVHIYFTLHRNITYHYTFGFFRGFSADYDSITSYSTHLED